MSLARHALTIRRLLRLSRRATDDGGTSETTGPAGFVPAFLDSESGRYHLARDRDGRLAAYHALDGLPPQLVHARSPDGRVTSVSGSVVSGFVRDGRFYTRSQAAEAVARSSAPGNAHASPDPFVAPGAAHAAATAR